MFWMSLCFVDAVEASKLGSQGKLLLLEYKKEYSHLLLYYSFAV
jgi:hypothetical protein